MKSERILPFALRGFTRLVAPVQKPAQILRGWTMLFLYLTLLGFSRSGEAAELATTIIGSTPAYPSYEVAYFTDNDLSTDYASTNGGTSTHVDFQFAGPVAVGAVVYTDRTSSGFFNGSNFGGPYDNVYSYKLIFSNEPTFTSVLWEQEFASPGYANTDPEGLINGGYGVTAEYVRWQVTATEGGNSGGAEIHFFAPTIVPEPAVGVLAGIGCLLLTGFRSRKQGHA